MNSFFRALPGSVLSLALLLAMESADAACNDLFDDNTESLSQKFVFIGGESVSVFYKDGRIFIPTSAIRLFAFHAYNNRNQSSDYSAVDLENAIVTLNTFAGKKNHNYVGIENLAEAALDLPIEKRNLFYYVGLDIMFAADALAN